jgi:hypothetical protein
MVCSRNETCRSRHPEQVNAMSPDLHTSRLHVGSVVVTSPKPLLSLCGIGLDNVRMSRDLVGLASASVQHLTNASHHLPMTRTKLFGKDKCIGCRKTASRRLIWITAKPPHSLDESLTHCPSVAANNRSPVLLRDPVSGGGQLDHSHFIEIAMRQ